MVWRSRRSTSSAQVLVQSCGHTDGTVSIRVSLMASRIPQVSWARSASWRVSNTCEVSWRRSSSLANFSRR